jgi:hypothetical protein
MPVSRIRRNDHDHTEVVHPDLDWRRRWCNAPSNTYEATGVK